MATFVETENDSKLTTVTKLISNNIGAKSKILLPWLHILGHKGSNADNVTGLSVKQSLNLGWTRLAINVYWSMYYFGNYEFKNLELHL